MMALLPGRRSSIVETLGVGRCQVKEREATTTAQFSPSATSVEPWPAALKPLQRLVHSVENLHFGEFKVLTVNLRHARQAINVRLDRNDSATRLRGEDATLREDSSLGWRYVEFLHGRRVDQLVEARVKIGVSEQSVLVISGVLERYGSL
jgi:hypothetical protein